MALDGGLLQTAEEVFARRYVWTPPALSLGKFQRVELLPRLPFDVVRRPSGGRAVLHGDDFEWSFAVVFPAAALGGHPSVAVDVATPYRLVADAFSSTLEELGVILDSDGEDTPRRSPFCFASVMRHDLATRGEKVVAVAQARAHGHVLVHGSVLERRPPHELTAAAELLLGEPWAGEGLAGAGYSFVRETLWAGVLERLETGLEAAHASGGAGGGTRHTARPRA